MDYEYDGSGSAINSHKRKKSRVYNSEIIQGLKNDLAMGIDIDNAPFYPFDNDLRAANVTYKMTSDEFLEYKKCFNDAEYFIEHYCKFLTDLGRVTVKLRDYQRKIVNAVTSQHYNDKLEEFVPDNKRVILLASRQIGKCYLPDTEVITKDGVKRVFNIFPNKKKWIHILKNLLIERYNKKKSPKLLLTIEYLDNLEFDDFETNHKTKLIKSFDIDDEVLADTGYSHANKLYITKPYQVYTIIFNDGAKLDCADEHILFTPHLKEIYAKDLRKGDAIYGVKSHKLVKEVIKRDYKLHMVDLSLIDDNHRYYTNGVLSHNTTTTAAYITWYICFHSDRNVGVMANKETTAIEIVDKIQQMIKGLPYFLKPGVVAWGKKGAKFDNGCAIISSTTTKSASIGFTMNGILYLDEFAHIEPSICYDFWRSVYPTLASSQTAQLIVSSTPNGTENNKFYDLWSGQDNGFHKIRVDYWEVPGHDEAWAEEQKKAFGEEEFNQEFLLQFSSSSRALLRGSDLNFIQDLCERYGKYVPKEISYGKFLDDERITWSPGFNPNSIKKEDSFVFLMDLADGTGDDDAIKKGKKRSPDSNTIIICKLVLNSPQNIEKYKADGISIKDAYRYIQVGKFETNSEDEKYCGNVAAALAFDLFYADELDNVRIMLEMNFNGKSCLDAIMNHPKYCDGIVLSTYHSKPIPGEKAKKKMGFKTTPQSKEYYCKRGEKMIRKRRIIVTDDQTYNQLKSFGYEKGTIKGIATHDDLSYPIMNHIPRMLDEDYFVDWLYDRFVQEEDDMRKYDINQLIEGYEMESPDMPESAYELLRAGNDVLPGNHNPYGYEGGMNPQQYYNGMQSGGIGRFFGNRY